MEDEQILNSLSHRDGKTYICNDCGEVESLINAGLVSPGETEKRFVASLNLP